MMLFVRFGGKFSGAGEEEENLKTLQTDGHTDKLIKGRAEKKDNRRSENLTRSFSF